MKTKHLPNVFLLILLICIGSSYAFATPYTLDLTGIDSSYGKYENIDRITLGSGLTSLNVDYGSKGYFDVGSTFTQSSFLVEVAYTRDGSNIPEFFTGLQNSNKSMYIYGSNLTGTITKATAGNPLLEFQYKFTVTGNEDIGIYIGDKSGINNPNDTKIANINLLLGDGDGLDGFHAGHPDSGTTRLTGDLQSLYQGMFTTDTLDFSSLPSGYSARLLLGTTNTTEETKQEENGFEAKITNSGHANIEVVPEPSTMILLGFGLLGIAGISRKKFLKK